MSCFRDFLNNLTKMKKDFKGIKHVGSLKDSTLLFHISKDCFYIAIPKLIILYSIRFWCVFKSSLRPLQAFYTYINSLKVIPHSRPPVKQLINDLLLYNGSYIHNYEEGLFNDILMSTKLMNNVLHCFVFKLHEYR